MLNSGYSRISTESAHRGVQAHPCLRNIGSIQGAPLGSQVRGRFSTEAKLVEIIRSAWLLERSARRESLIHSIAEFDCSFGIADLVFYSLRKDWQRHIALAQITPSWAFALKALPYRKPFSVEAFAKWTGVSERRAQAALKEYESAGFCKALSGSMWRKQFQPHEVVSSIVAIEAKLRDWKQALSQAYRYLDYATQAWVVLDHAHSAAAVRHIAQFERLNVGLASVDLRGQVVVHSTPMSKSPRSELKLWEANAMIAHAQSGESVRQA